MARASTPGRGVVAAAALAVLLYLSSMALLGATRVGITTDEPTHVDRLASWFDTGWYVPDRFMSGGRPDPEIRRSSPYVYGAAFGVLAHAANVVMGNERWGETRQSPAAYEGGHLVVAALAIATAIAVGKGVDALTGDKVAALWSSAALLAVPMWTGHSMFNVKDIPTAAGYTFVTVGMVHALTRRAGHPRTRTLAVVLTAAGTLLSVGTRTGMWVTVVAASLLSVLLVRVTHHKGDRLTTILAPGLGVVLGLATVVALHPRMAATPMPWIVQSVTDSSAFPWTGYTLTAGELLSEDPPLWYVPAWLGASLPLLLALTVLVGVGFTIVGIVSGKRGDIANHHPLALLIPTLQAFMLPVAAISTGSVLYTGIRQHIYMIPALVIMGGVGIAGMLRKIRNSTSSKAPTYTARFLQWTFPIIAVAALVKPAFEQTQLFPYNYVYINAAAGAAGINGRWETDYWGASFREAIRRVPAEATLLCSEWLIPPWNPSRSPAIGQCSSRHTTYMADKGRDASPESDPSALWVIGRVRGGNTPPDHCVAVDNVTRRLRSEDILVAYLLNCEIPAPT